MEKSAEDFYKLSRQELYKEWFIEALTDKQIAKRYGITKKEVKARRKELNIGWLNSALLKIAGGEKYRK